jgi:hypothetical protein
MKNEVEIPTIFIGDNFDFVDVQKLRTV